MLTALIVACLAAITQAWAIPCRNAVCIRACTHTWKGRVILEPHNYSPGGESARAAQVAHSSEPGRACAGLSLIHVLPVLAPPRATEFAAGGFD